MLDLCFHEIFSSNNFSQYLILIVSFRVEDDGDGFHLKDIIIEVFSILW